LPPEDRTRSGDSAVQISRFASEFSPGGPSLDQSMKSIGFTFIIC
jgi:hypothetical protein